MFGCTDDVSRELDNLTRRMQFSKQTRPQAVHNLISPKAAARCGCICVEMSTSSFLSDSAQQSPICSSSKKISDDSIVG